MQVIPAIMSGGSGTRLWPVSTGARPKQFHRILSDQSMIVETAKRFASDAKGIAFLPPLFVAGEGHRDILAGEVEAAGMAPMAMILEPVARNTAAAALAAALVAMETAPGAKVLLLPADHVIRDVEAFHSAIARAGKVVEDSIVTFGMSPTAPETGFGYIEQGDAISEGVFQIASFKEKPDSETAKGYLAKGGYSWNSGIFFYSPEVLVSEFEALQPEILNSVRAAVERARRDGGELLLDEDAFSEVKKAPIDIAIMEKTSRGVVVPCSIGWADVGSWSEYWRLSEKDADGNAVQGSVLVTDVTNTLVRAEPGIHVSVAGLDNLVIVATKDSVLVLPMDRAQDVKALIPDD